MFNSRQKELFNYILPSAGALCVTYLYNIVDGIFVGQGVGPMALAAVNITVPFVTALPYHHYLQCEDQQLLQYVWVAMILKVQIMLLCVPLF